MTMGLMLVLQAAAAVVLFRSGVDDMRVMHNEGCVDSLYLEDLFLGEGCDVQGTHLVLVRQGELLRLFEAVHKGGDMLLMTEPVRGECGLEHNRVLHVHRLLTVDRLGEALLVLVAHGVQLVNVALAFRLVDGAAVGADGVRGSLLNGVQFMLVPV